jgi:AraC family transcriptional regulator of adaptative response/methylated-DNA-[protein]-cysteine methyltransferase
MNLADAPLQHAARWRAVTARDAAADGAFVYAVKTTGVFCRPTCPSRRPKPENVLFFDAAAAAGAGYRLRAAAERARHHATTRPGFAPRPRHR